MSNIDGSKNLSQISIPGTHDTGTYGCMVDPSNSVIVDSLIVIQVKCQAWDFDVQLMAGIRFFDLRIKARVGSDGNLGIYLFHGTIDLDITYVSILNTAKTFLDAHPGEALIFRLSFANITEDFYNSVVSPTGIVFYTDNTIPTLNDVKGKIVIMRYDGSPIPGMTYPPGDNTIAINDLFYVEDIYQGVPVAQKIADIKENIDLAVASNSYKPWYITHTSFAAPEQGNPASLASTINPQIYTYIEGKSGNVGTVVMDFPGPTMIKNIIDKNPKISPPANTTEKLDSVCSSSSRISGGLLTLQICLIVASISVLNLL